MPRAGPSRPTNGLIIEGGAATWEVRPERMAPRGFVRRAESAPHANALLKRLRAWKNGLIENSGALNTMQTPGVCLPFRQHAPGLQSRLGEAIQHAPGEGVQG